MKRTVVAACAALAAASGMIAAPPAHAEEGKLTLAYSAAELSPEGDTLTWKWTLRNATGGNVEDVVATHRVQPALRIASVSDGCEVKGDAVRCDYGELDEGAGRKGQLVLSVPDDADGGVRISGRVAWRPAPAPASEREQEAPTGQR